MAMINSAQIPAAFLLLLTASSAAAQDLDQVVPVAEENIDESDEMAVPDANPDDVLIAEFEHFKQLMAENALDDADSVAKRVVELAIQTKGTESNEFAKALTNLAIVQFQTKQFESAVQNFETAIGIIEDNEDRLNAQLVNPLKGLGAAQLESGRPDLATRTFRRAVHVTHVNEGPHNLDQIDLLESIAESFVRMGDLDSAKQAQDTIYALNIRKYELDTPELVPALMRRAAWQHRAGFIYDERASYRRAIRILEQYEGKDSLSLVQPLILLGRSYFYFDTSGSQSLHDSSMTSGEIYFRRATRIATEHPQSDWRIQVQASLALGDFYMYGDSPQRARQVYSGVWELLSLEILDQQDPEKLDVRREQLERVTPLKHNKLPTHISRSSDDQAPDGENPLLQGHVTLSYTVSTRGSATDLKLVEAVPPEFKNMVNHVQREMRRRIYRPRLVDGEVVETPDLLIRHEYFYRQSDFDTAKAAQADESD